MDMFQIGLALQVLALTHNDDHRARQQLLQRQRHHEHRISTTAAAESSPCVSRPSTRTPHQTQHRSAARDVAMLATGVAIYHISQQNSEHHSMSPPPRKLLQQAGCNQRENHLPAMPCPGLQPPESHEFSKVVHTGRRTTLCAV